MQAYQKLEKHFSEIIALRQIQSLIDWDRSVMMPEQGAAQRARQAAVLAVKVHEMQTNPVIADWIGATNIKDLDPWQAANVRLMQEHYTQATAVSVDLVARKIEQDNKTEVIWRRAKKENNFKLVLPELEKVFDIAREYGAAKSEKLGGTVYEALMAPYVPHMTTAEVDAVLDDLAAFLPPFLDKVLEKQKEPMPLQGPFPIELQEKACRDLVKYLGFGKGWGRLDTSAHPFSTGIGGDVRITSRYIEDDFITALQCVAHEAGHGFYDHHTPQEWQHQPVGASQNMGMAIHESQSLGLEMQMGRSRAYWDFLAPSLRDVFGGSGDAWRGENLYRLATKVKRSLIRFEADEVTYPAHVILRYRMEKDLIEGRLAVRDIPKAWNAAMKSLIGVTPPDDQRGCLQDIHWYCGAIGYFPAYALGAVIAAQFAHKMRQDIPDLDAAIARGDFHVFVNWLKENVQSKACLYKPQDLIQKVTGEKMSARFIKTHLQERYLGA